LLDLIKEMRREQNRQTQLAMKAQNRVAHFVNAFRIQAVARLIQDKQLRLRQQRLGQSQARSHPMRVSADLRTLTTCQPDPLDDFFDAFFACGGRIGAEDLQVRPAA